MNESQKPVTEGAKPQAAPGNAGAPGSAGSVRGGGGRYSVLTLGFMPDEEDILIDGRVFVSLHKRGTKRRCVIVAPAEVQIDRVPALYPPTRRDRLNAKMGRDEGVGDG